MLRHLPKTKIFYLLGAACLTYACGENGTNYGQQFDMKFALQRTYTGQDHNQLQLDLVDPTIFSFSMAGEGFATDIPLNKELSLQKTVNLRYSQEGTYSLTLNITRKDGVNFISQKLQWTYSKKVPPLANAKFAEAATSTGLAHLLFPPQLDPDINEVWLQGDLTTHPQGQWYSIPPNLDLGVTVSAPDGIKTVNIKYRNIYGNEGPAKTLSILKKSVGPKDCQAIPAATQTYKTDIQVFLAAENNGPLFYRFSGDVEETAWIPFSGQVDAPVTLSSGNGVKHVIVAMQDIAGNSCPNIPLDLTVNSGYPPYQVTVQGNLLWTDALDIAILPRYDHLPNDSIEMFISGDVQNSPLTETWLPLSSPIAVALNPVNGNRFIYVQFRNSQGVLSDRAYVSIFLQPFLLAQAGSNGTWNLTPSHFTSLSSMTISGCQETYQNIGFQSPLLCTPTASEVTAKYFLSDKSSLTRSALIP